MCIARRISRAAGGAVAAFAATALLAPMAGGETADEWAAGEWSEHLTEIEPPEGYVLHDIKECPQGARTLALAVPEPDPRERESFEHEGEFRPVLLVLDEEGEPEFEIDPATLDFRISSSSLVTASWLRDGESFVFVAFPPYEPDPELEAELEEIREEREALTFEEERERSMELLERNLELEEKINQRRINIRRTTALFRYDAARDEVERLWDINQQVWDVDVDGEDFIHVALPDKHVYVLTPEGEHVTSHAIPDVPEASEDMRRLDASSQTVWANMVIEDYTQHGVRSLGYFIVRLRYGGEEPSEWEVVVEDAGLAEMAPCGAALLCYEVGRDARHFVYEVETGEVTRVPAAWSDIQQVMGLYLVDEVSLAPEGAAVRYKVVDVDPEEGRDPVKRWENTTLLEYTLPE